MAIYDNIKNIFKTKEQPKVQKKEAPIVYYNSLGYDSVPKISYIDLHQKWKSRQISMQN